MTNTLRRAGALVVVVAMLALAGCYKINADLVVDEELNTSGQMTIQVTKESLEAAGPSGEMALSQLDSLTGEVSEGVTAERVEDDSYVGIGLTMDQVPAEVLTRGIGVGVEPQGDNPDILQLNADGKVEFVMENPISTIETTGAGAPEFDRVEDLDEGSVSVTFPGNVITAEGARVEGNVATWDLKTFEGDLLTATAEPTPSAGVGVWLPIVIGAIVVIALAVVILLVVLRRRRPTQAAVQDPAPAPAPADQPAPPAPPAS